MTTRLTVQDMLEEKLTDLDFDIQMGDSFEVPVFQPRECEAPFLVAHEEIAAEQCDNCGGSDYMLTSDHKHVMCEGCRAPYRIFWVDAEQAIWPA